MSKYLYNGIEFPALPETHQYAPEGVALDYAVIYKNFGLDTIYLKFIDKPLLAYHESIMDNRLSLRPLPITDSFWEYKYKLNGNEWEDMGALINPEHITEQVLAAVQGVDPEGKWYQNKLIWSNHDIMDSENGSVYLAESEPVPVPDEPESVLAWQKHDAYKPNTKWDRNTFYRVMGGKWVKQGAVSPSLVEDEPTGEPIAYLYNGVRLPDINKVWTDKEAYPYAMLTVIGVGFPGCYALEFTSVPIRRVLENRFEYGAEGAFEMYAIICSSPELDEAAAAQGTTADAIAAMLGMTLDSYEHQSSGTISVGGFTNDAPFWASYDLLNEDGSVYLAASDPVPVYE